MAENDVDYKSSNNIDCEIKVEGVWQRATVVVDPNNAIPKVAPFALIRPASDNGLPTGNINAVGDFSSTNKEFYVEALPGERLAVHRVIVHIYVASQEIEPGTYGNVDLETAGNGLLLIYERDGSLLNVSDGLPLKKQEDWGRISFDALPVGPYGSNNKTPFFQVRLSFDKFAGPNGIILEEGDRLGVRLRDNLPIATILEHYFTFEGQHLGTPSAVWQDIISPLL